MRRPSTLISILGIGMFAILAPYCADGGDKRSGNSDQFENVSYSIPGKKKVLVEGHYKGTRDTVQCLAISKSGKLTKLHTTTDENKNFHVDSTVPVPEAGLYHIVLFCGPDVYSRQMFIVD